MTDKISLIKFGETYIKFNLDYSDINKIKITEILSKGTSRSLRDYFIKNEYFKISIEYDKGSLKTRIIIWCTAINIGISQYGSFRSGVREIINDSKSFSKFLIELVSEDPYVDNRILRTEKRTGLPGRMQELYLRIEHFEGNLNNMTPVEVQVELNAIKEEIANIIELLSNDDRNAFLNDLGDNYSQNLPRPNEKRIFYLINRYGLKPNDEIEYIDDRNLIDN